MSRKPIVFDNLNDLPESVISEGTMLWNKTGSWRYMRPAYQRLTPACNNGCPAGNNIEAFIRLAEEGQFVDALQVIKDENPLPGICGRVCFHPCETACNRKEYDHPIAISAIERFIAEEASEAYKPNALCPSTGKKIAVVGSGPASLSCAYHLARMGHGVMIFEKSDKPGGILRYGIPQYRLPKEILDAEIEDIKALGVSIQCNTLVGKDISWEDLDEYDALFIGTGCHKERPLFDVKKGVKGFYPSLTYLTMTARGETREFGKTTAVIGGGNSAIDAARTALRLGSSVTVFYHRTRNEMPAFEEEIRDAEKEGVEFEFLIQPVDVGIKWGKVKELKLRKTKLGEPDESGRRRPEPILGSDFSFKADTVVAAIGETPDFDILPETLKHDPWKVLTDDFGATGQEKVFAGGDLACDEHNIAQAIGSGKAGACAIDAFLSGNDINEMSEDICIGNTQR
ncbi:MAG: FAD-dependent oxidoreductase, partial [Desulfobacteraceae bacterium]